MTLLIAGLVLFLGAHSTRIFADDWRNGMIERLGEKPWKGLVTVVSVIGFVLIVIGYGDARTAPVVLWVPPIWTRHLAVPLTAIAFILVAAAYVPRNRLKARIGHPMVAGVKLWALSHLLANGTLADLLLFGGFLAWAIAAFMVSRRRDRANGTSYPAGTLSRTLLTAIVGLLAWAVFAMFLHTRWIGVSPLPAPRGAMPEAAISQPADTDTIAPPGAGDAPR